MRSFGISLILFLFFSFPVFAQKEWKPEHIVKTESAASFIFSDNADRFVWRKRRISTEKDRWTFDLWVTYLNGEKAENIQLSQGEESEYSANLSSDGNSLYYLSSADSKSIWLMNLRGGAPTKLFTHHTSVGDLTLTNDRFLFFTADEGETYYDISTKKIQDDTEIIEDSTLVKPSRVFRYDLETKELKRITQNHYTISEYAVSKNGKWMITVHRKSEHYYSDGNPHPDYYLWNIETGSMDSILGELIKPNNFKSSFDSNGFWFSGQLTSDSLYAWVGIPQLYYFDITSKKAEKLTLPGYDEIGGGGFLPHKDGVLVSVANGAYNPWMLFSKDKKGNWTGKNVEMPYSRGTVYFSEPAANGTIVANVSDAETPNKYWVGKIDQSRKGVSFSETVEFVKLNSFLDKLPKAKGEVITWTGALGETVEGILYYPHNYDEGKRYALIIGAHGGPTAADFDEWDSNSSYPVNLFSQRGAFFLKPNYHGSTSYGINYAKSILGDGKYYDLPLEDILKGIDHLDKQGLIDKANMGVMGWSNGAIYATMLSVRYPDMFKAVGAGAGDVNWTSDFGTCEFGVQFDQLYIGGAPYDDVNGKIYNEKYILDSPLFEMEKVKSPTIIFHGSDDRAVPRDQGWEYYRALQQAGNVPVKFLWFPGQPHSLQKVSHRMRKLIEEMKWFDTYMFDLPIEEFLVYDKESLLGTAHKRMNHFSEEGGLGTLIGEDLIPMTAPIDGMDGVEFGIYEVTQAQWIAFAGSDELSLSFSGNMPISDISKARAEEYVTWLSTKTGEKYRLPTSKEQATFLEKLNIDPKKENSLQRWVEYDIKADDYKKLMAEFNQFSKEVFLSPSGFFAPAKAGDHFFWDAGGNAGEWNSDQKSETPNVSGTLPSVLSFYDNASKTYSSPSYLMGLRVIKEVK